MNHLIFSAVLTACLGIGGHQYTQQHGPFNNPSGKYYYKEPAQLNSSKQYSWPTLVLHHSTQSVAIYTCIYYVLTYFAGLSIDDDSLSNCDSAHRFPSFQLGTLFCSSTPSIVGSLHGPQTDDQLDKWEEFKEDITHNFCVTESLLYIAIQLSNLPQKTTIMA
ncbi:hypothetical protein DSO57_1016497 [Entomophthora muscae]|uniref:Uncharacterized protein n=1 Tax=Entomophthora muscae TaxID=34485 RepID=A0ACC2TFH4_9FUNG|nr:hypothetical protein DSO57_1016497 [Entomophthora muscae]